VRPAYRYPRSPVPVEFIDRPNRYLARVRVPPRGRPFLAHVPNPGRMEELLVPGCTSGVVVPVPSDTRRTRFDLVAVRHGRSWVSVDSRIGNRLVRRALDLGALRGLPRGPWKGEFTWGPHRFDFAQPGRDPSGLPRALLEVKCSNLKVGRTAFFPDAPTERGARQLATLARAARRGVASFVVFLVQRNDVDRFSPNAALDPRFATALTRAVRAGVRAVAYSCAVRPGSVRWGKPLPLAYAPDDQRLL